VPKIPIIQGYTILSKNNNLEKYARIICLLFLPWHSLGDIKSDKNTTWSENLDRMYSNISTFDRFINLNINILHECKESRDANRLLRENEHENKKSCARNDDEVGLENEHNNPYNQGPDCKVDGLNVNICNDSIEQSTREVDVDKASSIQLYTKYTSDWSYVTEIKKSYNQWIKIN
jgi:hypothetical protein